MFNFQGSEVIIILLLALVVLGPEKLPDAMRKAGQMYGELKKMSSSFQSEFRSVIDEPMREVRETANMLRDSADFRKLQDGDRAEKPKSAEMADVPVVADPPDDGSADVGSADEDSADVPVVADPPDDGSADEDSADGVGSFAVSPPFQAVGIDDDDDGLREAGPLIPPNSPSEAAGDAEATDLNEES